MSYTRFPDSLHYGEITAFVFKDGRHKGIFPFDPEVHHLILDTSAVGLIHASWVKFTKVEMKF